MKKTLLALITLFSFSDALEVSKSKTFTEHIPPNAMSSNFILNYESQSSEEIEELFANAIMIVEKERICKGGKYSIYPNFYYEDNIRVQDGYRSHINFNCNFNDIKEYEAILTEIKSLNALLTQGKINHTTNDKVKERYKLTMENDAYIYAKDYLTILNAQFTNCRVKSINLNQNDHIVPYYRTEMAMADNSAKAKVSAPIKEDIKLNLRVDYKFECDMQ